MDKIETFHEKFLVFNKYFHRINKEGRIRPLRLRRLSFIKEYILLR